MSNAQETMLNREVRLRSRPAGIPQAADFEIVETPIPVPGDGQFVVRNRYLSVEPAMRGWIADTGNYPRPWRSGPPCAR